MEAQLDALRFVRVHRRLIVAIGRIREIEVVANGESILRLTDGRELRASRAYRKSIRQRWPPIAAELPAGL
jgi:two-component system LytT family response regulator